MIINSLCIYSQNVRKNKTLTNTILEKEKNNSDVVLIQEPPRYIIKCLPSSFSPEGDPIYGHPSHPEWIIFACSPNDNDNISHVIIYINKRLMCLQPMLRRDIVNHRDINLVPCVINQNVFFILNVYSDDNQTTISYLRDHELNTGNTLIMAGDFNICDSDWDPLYPHHSTYADNLTTIANSLNLD